MNKYSKEHTQIKIYDFSYLIGIILDQSGF